MSCAVCANNVESTVKKLPGVRSAVVNFAAENLLVEYDPTILSLEKIQAAVQAAGYDLIISEEEKEKGGEIQAASNPGNLELEPGQFVALIEFDWTEYLRKNDTRTVKKTLTIPAWLNALAEEQHINFSGVLKSALIEKLHA